MSYSVAFWNRIARRYAASPIPDQAIYEQKLAITREYLNADMDVLEFGCGTGSTAILHAPYVAHYHAIDVSPRMIEIANEKIGQNPQPNLSFGAGALEEYRADVASYDAVLGLNILHLMNDPETAIDKIYSLLKPGGVFVSSTACLQDNMAWIGLIAPLGSWLGLIPSVQMLKYRQLQGWLQHAGLVIEHSIEPEGKNRSAFIVARKPE